MTIALLLLPALPICFGFNLDSEHPRIFQMDRAGFGQSVVQFQGSRLVVGAPLEKESINQSGRLYDCEYSTGRCQPVLLQIPSDAVNMSLGLTLSTATNSSWLMACGPTVHQLCGEIFYLNGICFLLNSKLQEVRKVPASLRECPKKEIDIVFLIDGSGSIYPSDFERMKDFIRRVMNQFKGTKTLFSLMQYSHTFKLHFTFSDFRNDPNPGNWVDKIFQLRGLTYTASAIQRVVEELFQSNKGARKDATKILIVITDGEKKGDNLEYSDIIPQAESAGIIRYAIGVGFAFSTKFAQKELETIASNPPEEHVFQVNNFEALRNIQNQLQEKIFAIEGTQSVKGSFFEHELSQEGFSAVLTRAGPVLGAVGSYSWSGGFFLYPTGRVPVFFKTLKEDKDMTAAYLGYSMEMAFQKEIQKLILGAPRYQHTGMVVIFTQISGRWKQSAEVKGTQIGSNFGATLCPVDVNQDQSTDLILIGAPNYYEQNRGGQVHVCALPQNMAQWSCKFIVWGQQGHPLGRFGAALTVLGDVNGDKMIDVAVGAPGEEENHGAIYLFHGMTGSNISPSYSQRIIGSQFSPRIQYFGQSLSGGQDLTQDGLVDVAVGAQGQVLLLRTQPILRVEVSMNFAPSEVARSVFDCQESKPTSREAGKVTICFTVQKSSPDRLGEVKSSLNYDLALDPGRMTPRAIFEETKNQKLNRVQILGLTKHCQTMKLLLPGCVVDSLVPIILRLNLSLEGEPIPASGNLRPVLDVGSQKLFTAFFPFEKNCGKDSICEDDLSITFSFLSLQNLVVGSSLEMNVAVRVKNEGEDSYRTTVTFSYPAGLSYRRISQTQHQPPKSLLPVSCESGITKAENPRSSYCHISHPIFREKSEVNFNITFDVSPMAFLGDKLLFKANMTSENNMPKTNKTAFQLEIPVKYAVYMVIISHEESTKYLNFSATEEDKSSYVVEHRYQVNNLGQRKLPIKINFWIPVKLGNKDIWDITTFNSSQNFSCTTEENTPRNADFAAQLQKAPVLNCSIALCRKICCDIPSFQTREELHFTIKGNLKLDWFRETEYNNVLVTSLAEIIFNDTQYALLPGQEMFVRAQTKTKVERYKVLSPVPLIVGGSIGGLVLLALITAGLYKLGFFKRQYKDMMNDSDKSALDPNLPE